MNIGLHNSESQKLESNLLSSEDRPLAFFKPAQVTSSILTLPYLVIFVGIPTFHDFCLGVVFIQRRFFAKNHIKQKSRICALDYDLVNRPDLILNGGIREKENEGIIIFLKLFSLFRPSFSFNVCANAVQFVVAHLTLVG